MEGIGGRGVESEGGLGVGGTVEGEQAGGEGLFDRRTIILLLYSRLF